MVGANIQITFKGNRSDSVSQPHLMISALTDDSVVSQQKFGSWKIAIFLNLFGLTASHRSHLANIVFLPRALPLKKGEKCSIW